jgi:hypothetical protein
MCVLTEVAEFCKECDTLINEGKEVLKCEQGPCLMAYMEDGNQGGPPISRYLICRRCTQKVKEEIEELRHYY